MKMLVLCLQCGQMMKWYNDGWGTGAWFCFDCPEVIYPGMASKGDMVVVNANGSLQDFVPRSDGIDKTLYERARHDRK